MAAVTRLRKISRAVMFNFSPGPVVASQDCFSTTKSPIWASTITLSQLWQDLIHTGHCWADTEPNLSQISVPQGPAPIKASEIVMKFFNRFPADR
jgi:hypothetical protein